MQTEDRVYSRWLAISLFVVAVLFVMRAGLYVIYLYSPLNPAKTSVPLLRQLSDLSGSGVIGVVQSKPFVVARLTDVAGKGVRGQTVIASLSIINVQQEALQLRYGFEGTMLDFHGLPQGASAEGGGTYALPGFVPRAFLTPRVANTAGSTDSSGQVSFSKLAVSSSLSAKHQVTLQVSPPTSRSGGRAANASLSLKTLTFPGGTIDFSTPVASVRFLSEPLTYHSPPLTLGGQLPPLRVQVLDSSRRPLRGKVVVLQSAPPSAGEFSSLSARPDTLVPRFALLNGAAVSVLTDTTGIVTLSNVSVLASSTGTVMLEGVFAWPSVCFPCTLARYRQLRLPRDSPSAVLSRSAYSNALKHPILFLMLAPPCLCPFRLLPRAPSASGLQRCATALRPLPASPSGCSRSRTTCSPLW